MTLGSPDEQSTDRITESVVEDAALSWLEVLGYGVLHGPEIATGEPAGHLPQTHALRRLYPLERNRATSPGCWWTASQWCPAARTPPLPGRKLGDRHEKDQLT
jgi:hypothetical protein